MLFGYVAEKYLLLHVLLLSIMVCTMLSSSLSSLIKLASLVTGVLNY